MYTRVVGMENWRRGAITKPVSLASSESMGVSRCALPKALLSRRCDQNECTNTEKYRGRRL
jgi:hypothetical protein